MLEASTDRRKFLRVEVGLCRQVPGIGYLWLRRRCDDPIGEAEPLGVEPGEFPQLLRRPPDSAEALGALAQIRLPIRDAYGDDLVVPAARQARLRAPRTGRNDEFDGGVAPAGLGVITGEAKTR